MSSRPFFSSPSVLAFALAGSLTLAAPLAPAQPADAEKEPWNWTWEERIAARFDPAHMRERRLAYAAKQGKLVGEDDLYRPVIEGSRNPELFLPSELFAHLLSTAYGPEPNGEFWRTRHQDYLAASQLPEDFWPRLQAIARPLLERRKQASDIAAQLPEASTGDRQHLLARIDALQAPLCALRARGLRAARQAFGQEAFDRFLYESVGTGLVQTGDTTVAALVHVREGCR